MIVQHNIMAMNSYRQLSGNNSALAKNLEKLSSGYKINRAGDDAAGLAVSEKMRAQLRGLETAQKNANDGISLIQTAEGALTEVHSMLNRMSELAGLASNGIYEEEDLKNYQSEFTALQSEIDRISKSTNFNGKNLLDGSLGTSSSGGKISANLISSDTIKGATGAETFTSATAASTVQSTAFSAIAGGADGDKVSFTVTYKNESGADVSKSIEFTLKDAVGTGSATLVAKDGTEYKIAADGAVTVAELDENILAELKKDSELKSLFDITSDGAGKMTFESKTTGSSAPMVTNSVLTHIAKADGSVTAQTITGATTTAGTDAYYTLDFTAGAGTGETVLSDIKEYEKGNVPSFTVNGQKFMFVDEGMSADDIAKIDSSINIVKLASGTTVGATDAASMVALIKQKTGAEVAVNATAGKIDFFKTTSNGGGGNGNGLTLQIGETNDSFNKITVSVGNMNAASLGVGSGVTISDQDSAASAIKSVKAAISKVSSARGDLGALQNRLDHTINNLAVTTENVTEAEARIRDTDMAKEMMNYTKNNILTQAAQAMLAQANQVPQGVLQLLR